MLVGVANRLTTGKAVGIDIWQAEDLAGNKPDAPLENARREGVADRVEVKTADMRQLPFADGTFDAVAVSFGLRNLVDPVAGLRELARVTRSGGRLVVCEFSHPTWAPFRTVYLQYLMRALPEVARRVSSNPDAYVYLAESIRAWPEQPALAGLIGESGWRQVAWRNLTGGVVTLHRAIRD